MRYLVLTWKEKPEAAEHAARRYLRQVNREQKKMRLRAIAEREKLPAAQISYTMAISKGQEGQTQIGVMLEADVPNGVLRRKWHGRMSIARVPEGTEEKWRRLMLATAQNERSKNT